ncbi:MAG: hypothetical protein JNL84_06675 [Candidatus Accumulibacter sp.]|nr:hypothetical protein [Accumulibacter sp.]
MIQFADHDRLDGSDSNAKQRTCHPKNKPHLGNTPTGLPFTGAALAATPAKLAAHSLAHAWSDRELFAAASSTRANEAE